MRGEKERESEIKRTGETRNRETLKRECLRGRGRSKERACPAAVGSRVCSDAVCVTK